VANFDLPFRTPIGPLYRIARKPEPWAPPDWAYVGDDGTFGNRFDDSEGYFRVLYASSSPLGCFVETLARYRSPPNVEQLLSDLNEIEDAASEQISLGTVPVTWLHTRSLGEAHTKRTRFADVYSAEWLSYLRRHLEPGYKFRHPDMEDFDLAQLMSQERQLTQQIATVAYQLNYDGIYYQSRHGSDLFNWALFEPFELQIAASNSLAADHPIFHTALSLLNLSLDPSL
jgi:hypothetical protein